MPRQSSSGFIQRSSKGSKSHHPLQRRVSWGGTKSSLSLSRTENEIRDGDSRRSVVSGSGENIGEISHWPGVEPLDANRHSSIRSSSVISSSRRIIGSLCSCFGSGQKKALDGVIDGPKVKIDVSVLPIDYFSSYGGNIRPTSTALISLDGTTIYTYEDLNIISDQMAKLLKPIIEEKLKSEIFSELLQDLESELCVGVAISPSEKWVIVILSIWKLGLSYLPIRIDENPYRRVAKIIEVLNPLMIIGSKSDKNLKNAVNYRCPIINFEDLWEKVIKQRNGLKDKGAWSKDERGRQLIIQKLSAYRGNTDPSQRSSAVLHRFNGKGELTTTCVRNGTLWNRLHAEWRDFPYSNNEYTALYAAVDSHEFLGQMLAPLLAGNPVISMDATDLYSFAEKVAKWKIQRLKVFPELLRATITLMELMKKSGTEVAYFNSVKHWFCTGGSLRRELAISFFRNAPKHSQLINLYGCKEALSFVCYERFKSLREVKNGLYYEIMPIGRPVINTRIYVLDAEGEVARHSELGEVFITGLGITMNKLSKGLFSGESDSENNSSVDPKLIPNPNLTDFDDPMYKVLLKTTDFGRFVYSDTNKHKMFSCCFKDKATLQFAGNGEGEAIVENYRINTNELVFHLRGLPQIKACHVMVYRPGTQSMAILAFVVVAHRQNVTKEELHLHLCERVPKYMIPTIIFIPGLPIKNFKINNSQLVENYQKERMAAKEAVDPEVIGFTENSAEWKAASLLFTILFHCCGVGEEWVASHMNWSLTELNIPFTSLPRILKELHRHGYCLDMKYFFVLKTPFEIVKLMVKHGRVVDVAALDIQNDRCGQFVVEVISAKHHGEIFKFFQRSNYGCGYTDSVFYFCGMKKKQLEKTVVGLWPLVCFKAYSIAVRDKNTKKVIAALLNVDHDDKDASEEWAAISLLQPNKYYIELLDDIDESVKLSGLADSKTLQTLFFLVDPGFDSDFTQSLQVTKLLITKAIEVAKTANFHAMYIPIFDYFYSKMVSDAFQFDTIQSRQINTFEAKDGTKPFGLAPDNISGTVLHTVLKES